MRIALTGASSTGKTTLLGDLLKTTIFNNAHIIKSQLNVRNILSEMGVRADGRNNNQQKRRRFQWELLEKKISLESNLGSFITDRSTVDMAAYWIVRDTVGGIDTEDEKYMKECHTYALKYDVHIHLPFGKIPFTNDGKRPTDKAYNEKSCRTIKELLQEWELPHISLEKTDPIERVTEVIDYLDRSNRRTLQMRGKRLNLRPL